MKKISKYIKKFNSYWLKIYRIIILLLCPDKEDIASKTINMGIIVLVVSIGIFSVWSWLAPISSASIATGVIVPSFNKKVIQHLEGGIIEEILVEEGQAIVSGQSLIYLQNILTTAQNKMLKKQFITAKAQEIRLIAERDQAMKSDFTPLINQYKYDDDIQEKLQKIITTQENLFKTRAKLRNTKIDILHQRIQGLHEEITGLEAQKLANKKNLEILHIQEKMLSKLVKNNNLPLNKLLNIQKEVASTIGNKGKIVANVAIVKQKIAETELEKNNLITNHLNQTLAELQEVESKISDLTEQLIHTKDILKRTVIKSPVSGIVTDLKYHTKGAVIAPAAEIMYIVPQDDLLIVEARVTPNDIESVRKGLQSKVQLSAYKVRKVPKLNGVVLSISADILTDEITKEKYFLARIAIDELEIKKLKGNVAIISGMQVQVFIITGSRSLFNYIFSPIKDAAYRAFREE